MKLLILGVIASSLLFGTLASAAHSVCGDWLAYKDEICIKILDKSSVHNYEEATKLCQASGASLLSIRSATEQAFVNGYLFLANQVVDNVWLGAKYEPAAKHFKWNSDKSPLAYTNWAAGHPKSGDGPNTCVEIRTGDETVGKWVDESCDRRNLVVCQKPQAWTLAMLQAQVLELKKNQVPIGFIYVQLPKEAGPEKIWPDLAWTDVSATYEGVFFRVAGGDSDAFGAVQGDNAPHLTEVKMADYPNGRTEYDIKVPEGNCSSWTYTGYRSGTGVYRSFCTSGGEVRPKNMAVKVWKRVE